ncbi:Guanine nucleotide exchange factor lte1 [Elasticomyces elasticus]|nr:Guanine nucleotide exchange factor lte1 [Elasticomyces elasticus]KAK5029916.1 Guanine nucleotide exchange factor lte1 [Exophiala sideris]
MLSESSVSSRISLISVDPAVASHITGTTASTTLPPTSHYGSSPRKPTRTPDIQRLRGHTRNISAPSTIGKKRSNSLKRVKNSTEVLRQRSIRSSKKTKGPETASDNRAGRNFTVGNVGTGGLLYLKPSARNGPPRAPVSQVPLTTPTTAPALLGNRDHVTSSGKSLSNPSVISLPRSASPDRSAGFLDRSAALSSHGRAQSFSTVEESRQSLSAAKSKTVRIVIHRPEPARPKTARGPADEHARETLPTLAVPIPHYRIGSFRFSSHGTPILRNSSYTVTPSDVTPTAATFQADNYFGAPPASSLRAFARLEVAQSDQRKRRPHTKSQLTTSSKSTSSSTSTAATSIQPELFDDLTAVYDDPAVVRYCHNVREITAATPARIVAQISSDSFMDYELVSDFFLTFRSYMSTYTVLDLLLARLRWAIGRLEDDGRIIRVRAFAALRHWILNYFMDDFYADRRLRIRFCSEVNKLYADVKVSPENGFSDLKLLRDLKRCWNGRCSLCWNPEDFELDGDQEDDIQPGGLAEARDSSVPPFGVRLFDERSESPQTEVLRGPYHSWFEADPAVPQSQIQQRTTPHDQIAVSPMSDGSLQAHSCFPPKNLLRPTAAIDPASQGPHPVSVQSRRKKAPANLQVVTQPTLAPRSLGHKRGASSIDSNREPTPRRADAETPAFFIEDSDIIRGRLYSPSTPFVQIVSSSSMQSLETANGAQAAAARKEAGTPTTPQPVGRNLFGSLRKVLGNKQLDVTVLTVSQSAQDMPTHGHKSSLPLNVSKSHDELRRTPGTLIARKGEVRIDLLCAAVCQNYESKFPTKHQVHYSALLPRQPPEIDEEQLKTPRMASHATAQSGSILIVDDTGLDLPSMSGALGAEHEPSGLQTVLAPTVNIDEAESDDPLKRGGSVDAVATQRSSDVLGDVMGLPSADGSVETLEKGVNIYNQVTRVSENELDTEPEKGRPASPVIAGPATVRGVEKLLGDRQAEATTSEAAEWEPKTDISDTEHQDPDDYQSEVESKIPAQTLRRRPGGDLRRVENAQDLDHTLRHASLDTASVLSGSPHDSLLIMRAQARRHSESGPPARKPISMINTHSSQHLRPSFEAAVADFAAIPDDDDGGLEATLLKLEGRYEKQSPPLEQYPDDMTEKRRSLPDLNIRSRRETGDEPLQSSEAEVLSGGRAGQLIRERVKEVNEDAPYEEIYIRESGAVEKKAISSRRSSIYGLPTESVVDSEESFGSMPLLRRDAAHESSAQPVALEQVARSPTIAPGYFPQDPPQLFHLPKGPPPSGGRLRHSFARPETANDSNHSFLLDEDENLSDLSSEISVDIINYSEVAGRSISPMLAAPGTAISGLEIPAHPLTYASVVNLQVPDLDPMNEPVPQRSNANTKMLQASSTTHQYAQARKISNSQAIPRLPAGPAHLPFVLACDSQLLAQQMTLVEKSALCEIEWIDLVEMRWNSKAATVLDWVDCLTNESIRGIDLVITRFNLVVKWALSEIVLTQDIHERARVITKYIHVAAHARRLHNYATMLQLTIALTSTDCTRLTKTWDMVSAPDKSLLKHMEALVQPIRNFHDLRLEMESADLSDGCVPFIGLYVHDLTYNAQKPSHIPGGRGTESLINFERYRTTAIIVKGLLRLIDGSSKYTFDPVQGVIERCLWLAALSDDRIRSASKALEP